MKLSADNLLADELKNSSTSNSQSTATPLTLNNLILPLQTHTNSEFDSPTISHRLSNDHRNVSTNLSTSASLLDATTDDAMSSKFAQTRTLT